MARKKKAGGIKITPESEKAALAASIKQTLDATAPKQMPPLPKDDPRRELGAMEPGERIPVDHPHQGAPDKAWEWFDSAHSFDTELVIVIEPTGEHAWIAVQSKKFSPPILLHRLPLCNRKQGPNPF